MSAATATDTFSQILMEQRMRQLEDAFEDLNLYAASVQERTKDPEYRKEIQDARDRAERLMESIRADQKILMRALRCR